MARRQVIVQLDDELTTALDALAESEGMSRSALIRRAVTALLAAYETARKDHELVRSYRAVPQDPILVETARRLAAETTPRW